MVGIEAGFEGLPAIGFATGGIPDWLVDGVSGATAPGERPVVRDLADALVRALGDERHYRTLCAGARKVSAQFSGPTPSGHIDGNP